MRSLIKLGMHILTFCLFLCVACVAQANTAEFPKKGRLVTAEHRSIQSGGLKRTYLIQPVEVSGVHPVIIVLHGGTEDAENVWKQSSLPTLGQRYGFIVVAPNGINKQWNDARGTTVSGESSNADDVGFLKDLITHVITKDRGDPNAVFMLGVSNGGFMTMTFACAKGRMLRAGANIISDLPVKLALNCHPGKPLPWFSLNGDHDPIIPFEGQAEGVMKHGHPQAALLSADETFDFWARNAGCSAQETSELLPDLDRGDGSRLEKRTRTGCNSVQYITLGAGHAWPGLKTMRIVARFLGGINEDADAGTLLWSFFASTLR